MQGAVSLAHRRWADTEEAGSFAESTVVLPFFPPHASAGPMAMSEKESDSPACGRNSRSTTAAALPSSSASEQEAGEAGVDTGVVLTDCWALDLGSYAWERVKRAGMPPGPRSGFSLAVHRNRAVLFGGCVDHEAHGGEALVSEFYNELYALALDTRRWYPLALRGAPHPPAAAPAAAAPVVDASDALHRAAVRIQAHFRGYAVRKVMRTYRIGGAVSEMLYAPALGLAPPRGAPVPFGRIGGATAVVGNTLWLCGGMVEMGDEEITFDDLWCLDLSKLQAWECVRAGSVTKESLKEAARRAGEAEVGSDWATDEDEEE